MHLANSTLLIILTYRQKKKVGKQRWQTCKQGHNIVPGITRTVILFTKMAHQLSTKKKKKEIGPKSAGQCMAQIQRCNKASCI